MCRIPRRVLLFACAFVCGASFSCCFWGKEPVSWGVVPIPRVAEANGESQGPFLASYGRFGADVLSEQDGIALELPEQLSLERSFLLALKANKNVRVASLNVDVSDDRITESKGEFDPTVFFEAARGRTTTLPDEDDPTGEEISEGTLTAGVRKRIVTGTDVEVAATNNYERRIDGDAPINPEYNPGLRFSLVQDLLKNLGIDVNRTDILIAENNLSISREDLREVLMDNVFNVESTYWELFFALADLRVREDQLKRAQALVDREILKREVQRSAELDVKTARGSVAAQTVQILAARNRITRIRRQLLKLLGVLAPDNADRTFVLADMPAVVPYEGELEAAIADALESRPDIIRSTLAIANSEIAERFARNQRLPTLQLFGDYAVLGADDDFDDAAEMARDGDIDTWQVGVRFEVPIPNRTARSRYSIAETQTLQARVRLEAAKENLTREVADALADVRTAEARYTTAIEARQLATDVLAARDKMFSLGRSQDNLEVLRAQESLANAERDVIRAQADHAIALANLYRVQGVLLEKRGIAFVPKAAE